MKKAVMRTMVLLAFVLVLCPLSAHAAIDIFINDNWVSSEAIIVDGRTLVPVRGVFENLGYEVRYNNNTKMAGLFGEKEIYMQVGYNYFLCDSKEIWPDVPPQIINSRFYLPLRAVGEAIGADVWWDGSNRNVYISKYVPNSSTSTPTYDYSYTQPIDTNYDNTEQYNNDEYYEEAGAYSYDSLID